MNASDNKHLIGEGGRLAGHVFAIALGLVLMLVGVTLGVTIVALPIGLLLGAVGVALILWGITISNRQLRNTHETGNH